MLLSIWDYSFLTLAMRSSMINERLALTLTHQAISWAVMEKLAYIGFLYGCSLVFIPIFSYVLKPHYHPKLLKLTWVIGIYITLFTLFTPNKVYDLQLNPFLIFSRISLCICWVRTT